MLFAQAFSVNSNSYTVNQPANQGHYNCCIPQQNIAQLLQKNILHLTYALSLRDDNQVLR
jgi:hypothetical protein